jgi:hypothetical protein
VTVVCDKGAIFEFHILQVVHFELIIHQAHDFLPKFLSVALGFFGIVLGWTSQLISGYNLMYSYCLLTLF